MKIQLLAGIFFCITLLSIPVRSQSLDSAEYVLKQGAERAAQGDFDGAIADYTRAIQINSRMTGLGNSPCSGSEIVVSDLFNALSLNNRGFAHFRKGELEKALVDFDRAIRMQPQLADAYNNRGNVWQEKGDLEKALADFNQAIKLNPRHSAAFNNRANIHQTKGHLDEALADYNQSIALEPTKAIAFANRGLTLLQLGQTAQANADFQHALELNPGLKAQLVRLIQSEANSANLREPVPSTTNSTKEKP